MKSSSKTWLLVANRAHAQIFESLGALKDIKPIGSLEFPEGRLKNQEIDTDRSGGASTSGMAYSVHGLVNKGVAHLHMTQVFAKEIAEYLNQGRVANSFERLILVAEDRFLGEILASLDGATKGKLFKSIHKNLANLDERAVINSLRKEDLFQQEAA